MDALIKLEALQHIEYMQGVQESMDNSETPYSRAIGDTQKKWFQENKKSLILIILEMPSSAATRSLEEGALFSSRK